MGNRSVPNTGRPVFLLTDFGADSAYVGQMKAVIHTLAPKAPIFDLAHDIPAQDVTAGALLLRASYEVLPDKSLVVAVVDPGVGSERKIVAMELPRGITLLAPDNGLAWMGVKIQRGEKLKAVALGNEKLFRPNPSPVFHGRDIFAPVAAHLSNGMALKKLGPAISQRELVEFHWGDPVVERNEIMGRVIYVDRFGNAVTNIPAELVHAREYSHARNGRKGLWPLVTHYADRTPGQRLCLVGSYGYLELAVCNGSSGLKVGDFVDLLAKP